MKTRRVNDWVRRLRPRTRYDWISFAAQMTAIYAVWGPAIAYGWSLWWAIPASIGAGLAGSLAADAAIIFYLVRREVRRARQENNQP